MDNSKFYGLCIQGNVKDAIEYLKTLENDNDAEMLLDKYTKRFIEKQKEEVSTGDEWADRFVGCFFEYFQKVLMGEDEKLAEETLNKQFNQLLGNEKMLDIGNAEKAIEKILKEKGYQYLGGKTMQFWGSYFWQNTEKKVFDVELPKGVQKLTVFFMHNFYMLNWMHFATYGKYHAGGWAEDDGLYYVVTDKHDENSEDFKVWFLKHEAQHVYDYKHHPEYKGYELEYRAKLIELLYHSDTEKYMKTFSMHAKEDKNIPHAYASWLILSKLTEKLNIEHTADWWKDIDYDRIKKVAVELYNESESLLETLKEN